MSNDCIQFLIKVLQYSPHERISCITALADPYFNELRNQTTKLPNYRKLFSKQYHQNSTGGNLNHHNNANYQLFNNQPDIRDLPQLFDFDDRELSVDPLLNHILIPEFALDSLKLSSGDLQSFRPLTSEELKVTLD